MKESIYLIEMEPFVLNAEQERQQTTAMDLNIDASDEELLQLQMQFIKRVTKYAKFLMMPTALGMFVPCDEKGNPLEQPTPRGVGDEQYYGAEMDAYQKAKDRVLFKGFEMREKLKGMKSDEAVLVQTSSELTLLIRPSKAVRYIIPQTQPIELTDSAIKIIKG